MSATADTTTRRGLRGDESELYQRHHAELRRVVSRKLSACPALIEDACQRAWVIFLRRQPDRGPALFAWLRTVAVHEAYALSRVERRTVALEELAGSDGEEPAILADSGEALHDALEARRALRALAELPERQRRYLGRLAAGYSYQEIAETEGRGLNHVNKHLVRARQTLREQSAA